jgi:hypothetical protein
MNKPIDMDVYYDKLINHFYDEIYWKDDPNKGKGSISEWLQKSYGATLDMSQRTIRFDSLAKRTWFILRWI